MAEDDDQKTESATQRQRDRYADEGSVAQSRDLSGAVTLAAGGTMAITFGRSAAEKIWFLTRDMFSHIDSQKLDAALSQQIISSWMGIVLPLAGACALATAVASIAQMGGMRRLRMPTFRLDALNPLGRAGQLFAPKKLAWSIGKQLLKLSLMTAALWPILTHAKDALASTPPATLNDGLTLLGDSLRSALKNALLVMIIIGGIDYAVARLSLEKRMRMTKAEVRQESKEEMGNPQMRARMRSMRRALSRRRMMTDVKTADVVIVNPTHYAVALKYNAKRMGAPRVVAKGVDSVALKIREVADGAKVPVIENVPLARALHAQVKIGKEVPTTLFRAVAEVLAAVYRMRPRRTA